MVQPDEEGYYTFNSSLPSSDTLIQHPQTGSTAQQAAVDFTPGGHVDARHQYTAFQSDAPEPAIHGIVNNTSIHSAPVAHVPPPHHYFGPDNSASVNNHPTDQNTNHILNYPVAINPPANRTSVSFNAQPKGSIGQQGPFASAPQHDDMISTTANSTSVPPMTETPAGSTDKSILKKTTKTAACVTCKRRFVKNMDGATETQCAKKNCPGSLDAQGKARTPALDPQTGLLSHQGVVFYGSADAVLQAKEVMDPLTKLKIDNDDVPSGEELGKCIEAAGKRLYKALLHPCAGADPTWPVAAQIKYNKSQDNALKYCSKHLMSIENRKLAAIACTFAVCAVVKVHTEGMPKSVLSENAHAPDSKTKFHERVALVIDAVADNKIIAKEILKGEKLDDLAWQPKAWARRKVNNFVGNTNKDDDQLNGKRAREAAGVPALVLPKHNKKDKTPGSDAGDDDGAADAKRIHLQESPQVSD